MAATHLSREDAIIAMSANQLLGQLEYQFADDPAFGIAFSTYDPKFQMNIRLTRRNAAIEGVIATLEAQTGLPVKVSIGGSPDREIQEFRILLFPYGNAGKLFTTRVDNATGTLTVQTIDAQMLQELGELAKVKTFIRLNPTEPRANALAAVAPPSSSSPTAATLAKPVRDPAKKVKRITTSKLAVRSPTTKVGSLH